MNITELDKETIKKLGLDQEYKKATENHGSKKFNKEQVRSNALKALGLLAAFSQDERRRILNHAIQLNEV